MSINSPDLHEALCGTEEQYRRLFENDPTPMWVFDNETLQFLAVNESAIRLYGYSRPEFLGMRITEIRPAHESRRLLRHLSQMRRWHTNNAGVWKHRRKDGTIMDRDISVTRVTFHGREAWLVSSKDVPPSLPHSSSEHKRHPHH